MKNILKTLGISLGILVVCILAVGLILVRTGFQKVEYVPYDLPEQASTSWDKIFEHPAPISVIPFKTGEMQVDRYPGNPPHAEDRHKPTDIVAFGIRHEGYGDILIDTGFDRSFSEKPPFGNYPLVMKIFLRLLGLHQISQEQGHDIASLLEQHNMSPQQVFFTHLHADHAAGIPALPDNVDYVFDARELTFFGKATLNYYLPGERQVKTLDFSAAQEMPPLGRCVDLLGDGALWAVSTPGHSPGHISYVVNTTSEPVLITGDAAFYYWGFAHGIGADTIDMDADSARKSREQLLAFTQQYPQVMVFVGHEMPTDEQIATTAYGVAP